MSEMGEMSEIINQEQTKQEQEQANQEIITSYQDMLDNLYDIINSNINIISDSTNNKVDTPNVIYDKTKRTYWNNYTINCNQINKDCETVKKYFENEFKNVCSIDKKGRLIIKGKYTDKMIICTFKNYINKYVQCSLCKSLQTNIIKDHDIRLNFIHCSNCNYKKAIKTI